MQTAELSQRYPRLLHPPVGSMWVGSLSVPSPLASTCWQYVGGLSERTPSAVLQPKVRPAGVLYMYRC
eukprot:374915-Prorocentrum_minimum.AAC.1